MKKKVQSLLQKILGFENYLYHFSKFKISFFKMDSYEPEFFEFMKLIPDGDVLDIGANIGITTVPLAKNCRYKVHAIEPIPANCAALKRIVKHYKLDNVKVYEIALGDAPGELKLVVPVINNVRMQGLSHAYVEGQEGEWNSGDIYKIPMWKLDDIEDLWKQKIAAIKIDVENFEFYVLKGGKKLLQKNKPVIYCELWDNDMRQPVMNLLKEIGYAVKIFEGQKLIDFTNQPGTNFIFIHNDN